MPARIEAPPTNAVTGFSHGANRPLKLGANLPTLLDPPRLVARPFAPPATQPGSVNERSGRDRAGRCVAPVFARRFRASQPPSCRLRPRQAEGRECEAVKGKPPHHQRWVGPKSRNAPAPRAATRSRRVRTAHRALPNVAEGAWRPAVH